MKRRDFLKTTTAVSAAYVIGFYIPTKSRASETKKDEKALQPNAFVEITPDNNINFIIGQVEMGQGTYTTLAMCIAEELNVHWEDINFKPANIAPIYNSLFGPLMITGGSSSIYSKQLQMRTIGAAVNEMIISAAAKKWKVRAYDVYTKDSKVFNKKTKESMNFGDLVSDLSTMRVPTNPKIKELKDCKFVGKPHSRHPKEMWAKVTGKAEFGIDVRIPNMKYAAVYHPTVFGAKVKSFDASKALKKEGVIKVKQIPSGIAVIAEHWWIAKEALLDINVVWDKDEFKNTSDKELNEQYSKAMEKDGSSMRKDGDSKKAFASADKTIEAEYDFPFLAHAPMEPLGIVVHHEKDKATVWSSSQSQTMALGAITNVLGVKGENVTYHTPYLGGGFGRRGSINGDFVLDGAFVSKDEEFPIMTLWTREDDIKMGNYRPKYKNKVKVALDKHGDITAFDAKVASQSIFKGSPFEAFGFKNGVDGAQKEGLVDHPYDIDSHDMQAFTMDSPVPVLWWRSVGHTQSSPTVEGIVDEAAFAAGVDPIEYRINMLKDHRFINILKDVAEKANWKNRKKEKNVGYGVAIHESFGTICAQIAKVRVTKDDFKVEKVWASVDCGFAFNPQNVKNQISGSINFGIAALKYSEITITNGEALQNNFYDYTVSRISDSPEIEVNIINSGEKIGGIGEPGVPPILAAVPNALFDATGKRYHSMPIKIG
ncbi:molybdopterin cofactor-binding domain-containing protein [Arcobacter sp.]|uniref:molybdopterin cofactor-binding domain-containing protein n=1 Tax=Arcobacter sp. TaxID=1872629 RepID=UPI003C76466C